MARTYGLAADRVRAFEVVTGDGVFRRVTPTEHPDLFFALRGGKGAAGIVTAVEFDLVHLPTFYGGAVYFDGADAAAVIDRWRGWSDDAAGAGDDVVRALPAAAAAGGPAAAGRPDDAWASGSCGPATPEEGARLLDEIRAVAPVILDDAALKPYTEIDSVHADPVDPMPVVDPAILLNDFPAEAAERLLAVAGPGSGSPQVHGRGAAARRRLRPRGRAPERLRPPGGEVQPADRRVGMARTAAGGLAHADAGVRGAGRLGHRRDLAELRHPARRRLGPAGYDEPTLARLARGHRDLRPATACCRRGRTPRASDPHATVPGRVRPSGHRRVLRSASAAVRSRRSSTGSMPRSCEHLHRQPLALAEQAERDVAVGDALRLHRERLAQGQLQDLLRPRG